MEQSIGNELSSLRKEHGYTQDEVATRLGVSPQAVSKWENDQSYPDIMLLPRIATLYGVTIDELLLREKPKPDVELLPSTQRKEPDNAILHIHVDTKSGDHVKLNVPIALVKMGLEIGMDLPHVTDNPSLASIDFTKLIKMVDQGLVGKLVEVESADGDTVSIVVE